MGAGIGNVLLLDGHRVRYTTTFRWKKKEELEDNEYGKRIENAGRSTLPNPPPPPLYCKPVCVSLTRWGSHPPRGRYRRDHSAGSKPPCPPAAAPVRESID